MPSCFSRWRLLNHTPSFPTQQEWSKDKHGTLMDHNTVPTTNAFAEQVYIITDAVFICTAKTATE